MKIEAIFVLDENVPASVGKVIEERGHSVSSIRDHIVIGSPDPVVAAVAESRNAVLVTHDRDFKAMVSRVPDGQKTRYRRLSAVRMECEKPQSARRFADALSLIEHEIDLARNRSDKRMIVVVKKQTIVTHR